MGEAESNYDTMMYFNTATITTAGYGDYNAKFQEWYRQFIVMMLMIFGISFYGFTMSKVDNIKWAFYAKSILEQERIEEIDTMI